MRVLVFEHFVGGGALHRPLPVGLAAQAGAMLAAAVGEFQRAGCDVVTTRDVRAELVLGAAETFTLAPGDDMGETFDRAVERVDAALVIAPETGGVLADWTRRLERSGVLSLGSSAAAIELCGDKLALYDHWVTRGVPTPATALDARAMAGQTLGGPVVVKPRNGAGCEEVRVLRDRAAMDELAAVGGYVFQPWCAGRSVSVSLLIDGDRVRPLPAGEQWVRGEDEGMLRYEGGRLPLDPALAARATPLAIQAARTIAGLHGFVGVDLVLGDEASGEADVVIEINPRLTLSFVALSRVCEPALGAALLDSALEPRWSAQAAHGVQGLSFDAAGRVAVEV